MVTLLEVAIRAAAGPAALVPILRHPCPYRDPSESSRGESEGNHKGKRIVTLLTSRPKSRRPRSTGGDARAERPSPQAAPFGSATTRSVASVGSAGPDRYMPWPAPW